MTAPATTFEAQRSQGSSASSAYRGQRIAIRQKPDEPDDLDALRVEMVRRKYHSQDDAYLGYMKTVEEHIRMLCNRQWDVWSDLFGRFIDPLQFMTDDERRWRMRPMVDWLGYWFVVTMSKAIENRPVISFSPATSDRNDAILAEVMDPIWKTLYDQMNMDVQREMMLGWLLVAGEGHYMTFADFQRGEKRQLIAPAKLQLLGPNGQPIMGTNGQPIERQAQAVPYDEQGNPKAELQEDPDNPGQYGYNATGEPFQDIEGMPTVETLCPLQVRAQWGNTIAWNKKRWIAHEWFLLPEQIEEMYGVVVEPDYYVAGDDGPGYLERMLFGTGYFGATQLHADPHGYTTTMSRIEEGYVRGISYWEKPIPGFSDPDPDDPTAAGGRLLVVAPQGGDGKVLWDSERPFKTECAGPIRRVRYMTIPGRPQGSTILEKLVPSQKRLNKVEAHIAQHTNLCADPILAVHEATDIDPDQFIARPGLVVSHGYNGSGSAMGYVTPPRLSADVWQHKKDLREHIFVVGSLMGNQSSPPTSKASGELVEQLRVNADRPLQTLLRNLTLADADVAEDVLAVLPTIWTQEKLIGYNGKDNIVRTLKVLPDMFEGRIHVRPIVEAATAESRDRKRARLLEFFQLGGLGDLEDPKGRQQALGSLRDLLNYPDLGRMTRPGGVDRVMAEHNIGRLIRGESAADIPLLEVYDFDVHLEVIEGEMKGPEFLNYDVAIQQGITDLRQMVLKAGETAKIEALAQQFPTEVAKAVAVGHVHQAAQASGAPPQPQPHPAGPAGPGAPPNATSRQRPPAAGGQVRRAVSAR